MARGAKNHRFWQATVTDRSDGRSTGRPGARPAGARGQDRRSARDRRDPSRDHLYDGVERRHGPRREGELPEPIWRRPLGLIAAASLGVLVAGGLGQLPVTAETPPLASEAQAEAQPSASPATAHVEPLDPLLLAEFQAMRDEAEALTPAEVTVDERAQERWMPRVARIEQARSDPNTPALIRSELDATIAALVEVGLLDA